MRKTSKIPNLSEYKFLDLYRTESNPRGKIRLLALHHLQSGQNIKEVASIVCVTRSTIYEWISWFKKSGVERLISSVKGRGCKKRVQIDIIDLQKGIQDLQESRQGGRIIGKDIIKWLKKHYNVEYSEGHIYNFLKSNKLSWVSVRSKHPKSNLEDQEEFKKNLL